MYFGAEHLIGFFTVWPSAQWYSYFGPADIMGQLSSVQNSVIVPYSILIWLKKSTAVKTTHITSNNYNRLVINKRQLDRQFYNLLLTATHSFKSSPSGNITASRKFPEPRVAAACFIKSYWWVPSGIFFFGLKVLEDLLPLERERGRKDHYYLSLPDPLFQENC